MSWFRSSAKSETPAPTAGGVGAGDTSFEDPWAAGNGNVATEPQDHQEWSAESVESFDSSLHEHDPESRPPPANPFLKRLLRTQLA